MSTWLKAVRSLNAIATPRLGAEAYVSRLQRSGCYGGLNLGLRPRLVCDAPSALETASSRRFILPSSSKSRGGIGETQIFFGNDKQRSAKAVRASVAAFASICGLAASPILAQYAPPAQCARVLRGVDFAAAQTIAPDLTQVYQACDQQTTRGGCATDPARNTVMLKFPDSVAGGGIVTTEGPVFFDAKMAIDADGSTLSKRAERPNQPETALRYPVGGESLDSERVPYIVMPLGNFRQETGVALGDLAAVVKDGQVHFAIVGDLGPRTHLGEGSMALHAAFGHLRCTDHDAQGNCAQFVDVSLDPPVLYFVFPESRGLVMDGLSPENVNARIERMGRQLWGAFLIEQGGVALSQSAGFSPSIRDGMMSRAFSPLGFSGAANPALAGWAVMSRAVGAGTGDLREVAVNPPNATVLPGAVVDGPNEMRGSFAPLRMTSKEGAMALRFSVQEGVVR